MMQENTTISQVPDKDYCCDYDAGKYDNDHHQAVNYYEVHGKRYHKQYSLFLTNKYFWMPGRTSGEQR